MSDILGDRYYWYSAKQHQVKIGQSYLPIKDDDGMPIIPEVYVFPDGAIASHVTEAADHDCLWDDMRLVRKARLLSAKRVPADSTPVQP